MRPDTLRAGFTLFDLVLVPQPDVNQHARQGCEREAVVDRTTMRVSLMVRMPDERRLQVRRQEERLSLFPCGVVEG